MATTVEFGWRRSALVMLLVACSPAGPQPQTITLVADRATAVANGTDAVTLTATTAGAGGAPLRPVVDFTVTDGGRLSASQVTGDAAGSSTTRVSATVAGTVTVTASAPASAALLGASASVTVSFTSPSGPRLRFQVSPSNTLAQNLLRPVPVVVVEDSAGVVASSSASVTVAITPGSCGAALDATSLMTVTASQGLASFYGLKSSTPATGCTLTATSPPLPPAVSTAFDIQ